MANGPDVLNSKDTLSNEFMSPKEKFKLLLPRKRLELLKKMSDEEAARLDYDWEWNARPKQLSPDYMQSKATSFCMCKYLDAQSKTQQKLKLEQFPSCTGQTYNEVTVDEDGKVHAIQHTEPKVCEFRQNWQTWVLLAGRGFGKTRVGAELVRHVVDTGSASLLLHQPMLETSLWKVSRVFLLSLLHGIDRSMSRRNGNSLGRTEPSPHCSQQRNQNVSVDLSSTSIGQTNLPDGILTRSRWCGT